MKERAIAKVLIGLLLGTIFFAGCKEKGKTDNPDQKTAAVTQYTCPMHPQIVQNGPGKCPICGMDLVLKQAPGRVAGIDTGLAHLLKPVNEQVVAKTTTIQPESGTRIFSMELQGTVTYDTRRQTSISSRVSGRIERLYVKYNYQPIKSGQLIMEIYSPDLAAAQRELLYLRRTGDQESLLQKAMQRLQLLGMQPAQIQQVLRTGNVLYRVPVYSGVSGYILEKSVASVPSVNTSSVSSTSSASGGGGDMGGMSSGGSSMGASGTSSTGGSSQMPEQNTAVMIREGQYVAAGQSLFTVYNNRNLVAEFALNPSMAAQVKRGQKVLFRKQSDPQTFFTGSIGLIQPVLRAGSNFTVARVYTQDSRLQPGQLLSANIPIVGRGWWVPASAVLQLGTQAIVFKKEGAVFVPKAVNRGMTVEGLVQITEGVSGWEIAKNAAYLVDSESFIRISAANQTEEQ